MTQIYLNPADKFFLIFAKSGEKTCQNSSVM